MTTYSNIDPTIDEQFPHPGQDNDSQVFRDNFTKIKSSLTNAKSEIEQFLNHGVRDDSATTDLNGNTLSNAVLTKTTEKIYNFTAALTAQFDVDFNNGPYQLAQVGANVSVNLINFPSGQTATKNGRVTLHLTSTGTSKTVTFTSTNGTFLKYDENFPHSGNTKQLTVASDTNPVIVEIWKFKDTFYLKYIGTFA